MPKRCAEDSAPYSNLACEFVSVAIGNRESKIENLLAGVVQWQNGSFPSCTRGFDSPHPLFTDENRLQTQLNPGLVRTIGQNTSTDVILCLMNRRRRAESDIS
jgi:hypothetical protein